MHAHSGRRYSNPPLHGALLVHTVLSDPALKAQWYGEVKEMADRIITMRSLLRAKLEGLGSPLSWEHITNQIGGRVGLGWFGCCWRWRIDAGSAALF